MGIEETCLLAYVGQVVKIYDPIHHLEQVGVLVPTQGGEIRARYGVAYRRLNLTPTESHGIYNIYPPDVKKIIEADGKSPHLIEIRWPFGGTNFAQDSGVAKALDSLLRRHGL